MNREKSLYFRKVTDVANDDDSAASVAIPVSNILYLTIATANLRIRFRPLHAAPIAGQAPDYIDLPCTTFSNAQQMASAILEAINYGEDGFIIVVDNTNEVYLVEDLCDNITSINITS